jgi:hypothetical protein
MVPIALGPFLAVHRERNLGRAAAVSGLSQPAQSKAMRRWEAEFGAELFERRAARVVPTVADDTRGRETATEPKQPARPIRRALRPPWPQRVQ